MGSSVKGESIRYYAQRIDIEPGVMRIVHIVRDLERKEVYEMAVIILPDHRTEMYGAASMERQITCSEIALWKGVKIRSPGTYLDMKKSGFIPDYVLECTEMPPLRHYIPNDDDRDPER